MEQPKPNLIYKIAKKLVKTRYIVERFPQDFQGAAPEGIEIVCLSSDEEEEMDDLSITYVLDLQVSSEDKEIDDEITMMAQCVELELSAPFSVQGPSTTKPNKGNLLRAAVEYNTPKRKHNTRLALD